MSAKHWCLFALACASLPTSYCLASEPVAQSPGQQCTGSAPIGSDYARRVAQAALQLHIPADYPDAHHLQPEARDLVAAGRDVYGRPVRLTTATAQAWTAMTAAAARQGIILEAVSGYRSFGYQRGLVARKLQRGLSIGQTLRINAAPGFSEHHTGCALDLTTPGTAAADAAFAATSAYAWLQQHGEQYGFHLSYTKDNIQGIEFEPWHWRFTALPAPQPTLAAYTAHTSAGAD